MKNNTTRLATVAVVVVMGAFAIALAQHDSRQRSRDSGVNTAATNEPVKPLVVAGDWTEGTEWNSPATSAELPELPSASQPASPPASYASYSLSDATEDDTSLPDSQHNAWPSEAENELRSQTASYALSDVDSPDALQSTAQRMFSADESESQDVAYPDSQVIAAAAQEPLPQTPPTWLNDTAGVAQDAAASLPQLPTINAATEGNAPNGLPALPTFPLSAQSNAPAPNSPSGGPAGGSLPAFPSTSGPSASGLNASGPSASGQGGAALGLPQLPDSARGLPGADPRSGYTTSDLSDTQRGAMAATDLAPRNVTAGPAGSGPANTSTSPAMATFPGFDRNASPAARNLPATPAGASRAAAPNVASGSLVSLLSDVPGDRYLEGSQNPIMLMQKRAPDEIQVGKPATFVITVRNAGNATAHQVTVLDTLPRGMRFVDATPTVQPTPDGLLSWNVGDMAAGDERTISMQLQPEVEGELGSMALVTFATQASVRTVATQPRVEVLMQSSEDVLIGSAHSIQVTISNSGTGVARDVRLEADIPAQLRHDSGEAMLVAVIGDLRPNESKRLNLTATAVQPGVAQCVVRAVNDDGTFAEQSANIQVKSPQLVAAIEGPSRRYLERQATYRIAVKNSGTAAATDLDFVIHLPRGLRFINLDIPRDKLNYDTQTNTVQFGLEELAAGQTAPIELTVLPVEIGQQAIKFNASGALGVTAEAKGQVQVDGLAELAFSIGQDNGTVEVGATTTYSVQVSNVGDQIDRQVQLAVQLPAGSELLAVDAPVEYRLEGQSLVFSPLGELKTKTQHIYRFQVRHNSAGNQIVRTQLTSANWPVAVVKEEGTLVYNDQN